MRDWDTWLEKIWNASCGELKTGSEGVQDWRSLEEWGAQRRGELTEREVLLLWSIIKSKRLIKTWTIDSNCTWKIAIVSYVNKN